MDKTLFLTSFEQFTIGRMLCQWLNSYTTMYFINLPNKIHASEEITTV